MVSKTLNDGCHAVTDVLGGVPAASIALGFGVQWLHATPGSGGLWRFCLPFTLHEQTWYSHQHMGDRQDL